MMRFFLFFAVAVALFSGSAAAQQSLMKRNYDKEGKLRIEVVSVFAGALISLSFIAASRPIKLFLLKSIQRSMPVMPGVYSCLNSYDHMPKLFSSRKAFSA